MLWEVESGQHSEFDSIVDGSCSYKCHWTQWKALAVNDKFVGAHKEVSQWMDQATQIILPQYHMKVVLGKLHGGSLGEHPGFKRTLDKVIGYGTGATLKGHVDKALPALAEPKNQDPGHDSPAWCWGAI
jgi:hypothetical protein